LQLLQGLAGSAKRAFRKAIHQVVKTGATYVFLADLMLRSPLPAQRGFEMFRVDTVLAQESFGLFVFLDERQEQVLGTDVQIRQRFRLAVRCGKDEFACF
jgi:hypothetical protein